MSRSKCYENHKRLRVKPLLSSIRNNVGSAEKRLVPLTMSLIMLAGVTSSRTANASGYLGCNSASRVQINGVTTNESPNCKLYKSLTNSGTLRNYTPSGGNPAEIINYSSINNNNSSDLDNLSGSVILNGAFFGSGIINNSGALNNFGRISNNNYAYQFPSVINNESGGVINNHAALDNYSSLNNFSGGTINNSGFLNNYNTLYNGGKIYDSGAIGGGGNITNSGYLNVSGYLGGLGNYIPVTKNYFIMNVTGSGVVQNGGSLSNYKDLYNHGTLQNSDTLNNFGRLLNYSTGHLMNYGALNNDYFLVNKGTLYNGRSGLLENSAGAGGTTTSGGRPLGIINYGTLNNDGTINNLGSIVNNGKIYNGKFPSVGGTFNNASGATLINNGEIYNSGQFVDNGIVSGTGTFWQSNGGAVINGTLTQSQVWIDGGSLMGTGTINAPVQIDPYGGLIQGGNLTSAGTLTINGNLTVGTYGIIQSLIFSSGYTQININGTLSTQGVWDIAFGEGFNGSGLKSGMTYDLLNFDAMTGSFSAINWGYLDSNGVFTTLGQFTQSGNNLRYFLNAQNMYLDFFFNSSGLSMETFAANDGGSGGTSNVPEPSDLGMMGLGLGFLGWFARRSRQKQRKKAPKA